MGYGSPDEVLAELLLNPNVAPAVLAEAGRLAAARPGAAFAATLAEYQPLPAENLALPLYLVAEKSRDGETFELRRQALELYVQRKLRSW